MRKLLLPCLLIMLSLSAIAQDYDQWHQERLDKLTKPDGYLSLVGLEWVKPEPRQIEGLGKAWLEGTSVHVELDQGHSLDGVAVDKVVLDSEMPEGEQVVRKGTRSFYVIRRGPLTGLRMKDSKAPTLVEFDGVERFAADPAWNLEGRLVKEARQVDVASVVGVSTGEESPGWAEFQVAGATHRVRLIGKPDGERFFLVFSDATAGKTTYSACRFLYVDRVADDGLMLDFNKSINPACAFTHYATCPLPPKENVFRFAISAGEKKP
jgi:uncharacterized protein (DUF1684 family)